MKLRHFVSGSSAILVGWLGVTFVYDVPTQCYPKLDKYPATAKTAGQSIPGPRVVADPESVVAKLSRSR